MELSNRSDDVEKSLELLDKVLSEFEDPDSLPHIEPGSPSQGNQSEDDGYMSMNGRRTKTSPDLCHHHNNNNNQQRQHQLQQQVEQQHQVLNQNNQSESESSLVSSPLLATKSFPVTNDQSTTPDTTVTKITLEEHEKSPASSPIAFTHSSVLEENIIPKISPRTSSMTVKATTDDDTKVTSKDYNNDVHIISENHEKIQLNSFDSNEFEPTPEILVTKNKQEFDNFENNGDDNSGFTNLGKTPSQTTLPKSRPSTTIPSRYSSLPCNGSVKNSSFGKSFDGLEMKNGTGSGSFDAGRNILGMGISAVHDAVLRGGVARLPEPIVNEHPVTIYPGRASPPRSSRVPPRTLPGSIERHREVCRNLNSFINSNTLITDDSGDYWQTDQSTGQLQRLMITNQKSTLSSPQQQQQQRSYRYQQDDNQFFLFNNNTYGSSGYIVETRNLFNNLVIPSINKKQKNSKQQGIIGITNKEKDHSDSEEFSDDSLERQSLPPPPPPPVVPPPPSLSAPVTPSKRGSIAWEINLNDDDEDDNVPLPPPPSSVHSIHQQNQTVLQPAKKKKAKEKFVKLHTSLSATQIVGRRNRRRTASGSQSSLMSTPGNSIGSLINNYSPQDSKLQSPINSAEHLDVADVPICSTEDEATSLYSDSDEILSNYPINMTGQGTYIIRKGRRERQRLSDLNSSVSSSINSRHSSEGNIGNIGHFQNNNLLTPNSRHSIDLGLSSHSSPQNPILSPRSRLSLDLNSPVSTSEQPKITNLPSMGDIITAVTSTTVTVTNTAQQPLTANVTSHHYPEFKTYSTKSYDGTAANIVTVQQITQSINGNGNLKTDHHHHHHQHHILTTSHDSDTKLNNNDVNNDSTIDGLSGPNSNGSGSLTRSNGGSSISSKGQQPLQQQGQNEIISTPRRELAPPIEEDEEQDSESQRGGVPLHQIENNISALLRGDISIARVGDIKHTRRPLGFRPGVHKSESAKEMLLSQASAFGPLPPSPPSSCSETEIDGFPPLPPSPQENPANNDERSFEVDDVMLRGVHGIHINSRTRLKSDILHLTRSGEDHLPPPPPAVPPHRSGVPSLNTLKTRSMDTGYTKKYMYNSLHGNSPGTLPNELPTTSSSRRRLMSGAFPKRSVQSPREERRIQTSCSLPETPIFARGCDIPRTPHRRTPETPNSGGSRTAPRTNTTNASLNSSIVGIGTTLNNGRQRSISQALASTEMLRLTGGPGRGWYPKQRNMRPTSTEHLDSLNRSQGSMRTWDSSTTGGMHGTGASRKPLTLPPNLTPKFFNKSPREALRRVTSLLIKKGNGKDKESKREKEAFMTSAVHRSPGSAGDIPVGQTTINDSTTSNHSNHHHNNHHQKKKGFFKSFWKKSKHYSLDQ